MMSGSWYIGFPDDCKPTPVVTGMAKTLDYARLPRPPRRPDWLIILPAVMLTIPAGVVGTLCTISLISPPSPNEGPPSAIFLAISVAALLLEACVMFRIALAIVPLVIGCALCSAGIIANAMDSSFGFREHVLTGAALSWMILVIAGHARWYVILRADKRVRDSN
jgi:hypothetical protein